MAHFPSLQSDLIDRMIHVASRKNAHFDSEASLKIRQIASGSADKIIGAPEPEIYTMNREFYRRLGKTYPNIDKLVKESIDSARERRGNGHPNSEHPQFGLKITLNDILAALKSLCPIWPICA